MLIDCSYFAKGPRHILNATLGSDPAMPNPDGADVREGINAYIEEYQQQFLSTMLGHSLSSRVNSYLVCLDEDEETVRVDSFDAVCERLREAFADYVFFHILRDSNFQATIRGLVILKSANTVVAPIGRQVSVWNTMVDRNRLFAHWCDSGECPLQGIKVSEEMVTKINTLNL